ncbi:hypothetical protein DFH06DRAFT_1399924 [Mycena polygramma]|nr:hypothetical protein DFH06DRAFT_1399924 [Mycena polygramma]
MTTMTFAQYATPHPNSPFSAESLRDITVAEASDLIQNNVLPLILPKNTVKISFFDPRVPVDASEITLAPNEVIPCAEDMLPITQAMEAAFLDESARSVCVELPHGYVIYHLSKIRVIMNVNNHMSSLALVARLLAHAKSSSLLLPSLIQELEASRYAEPLAGFHVTETPLYTLGCLLDERWALEDVLNARAELTYFHRAASLELGQDPSLLFIDLVCHALENPDINLGSLIFGADLWSELHSQAGLPPSCLSSDNVLARFFAATPIPPAMSATWLDTSAYTFLFNPKGKSARRASHIRTLLYRASATDIWSVIPAYPDNSAPIPRRRPPKVEDNNARKPTKRKVVPPKVKPTPMKECDSTTREKALLSYIIQYTQDYTVGPLDYCGVARLVKGRGSDIIMYCKGDPRVPEFYQRRRALAEVTVKLKRSGEEKHGLSASTIANVDKKLKKVLPVAKVGQTSTTTKENREDGTTGMMKKKRHSADRDLALEGLVLSPRKRCRIQ